MLAFDQGEARFHYRVGVALDGARVLLPRAPQEGHWALPGGRVEIPETTLPTIPHVPAHIVYDGGPGGPAA